ncbi:hypothetical protein QTP88_012383 [Uroleucon formosanum]
MRRCNGQIGRHEQLTEKNRRPDVCRVVLEVPNTQKMPSNLGKQNAINRLIPNIIGIADSQKFFFNII